MSERFVVVTTEKRGVFAGVLLSERGAVVQLKDARMCVYWSADVGGVVGLAAVGPSSECRITKAAPKIKLRGMVSVMDCTDEARRAWKAEPWK